MGGYGSTGRGTHRSRRPHGHESSQGRGNLADQIHFVRSPGAAANGERVVQIHVQRFDAAWKASGADFHVGPGGTGAAIAGRYSQAKEFLNRAAKDGSKVHMTRVSVGSHGEIRIVDGRHRFAVLRDSGATVIPVTVSRSDARMLAARFGANDN